MKLEMEKENPNYKQELAKKRKEEKKRKKKKPPNAKTQPKVLDNTYKTPHRMSVKLALLKMPDELKITAREVGHLLTDLVTAVDKKQDRIYKNAT